MYLLLVQHGQTKSEAKDPALLVIFKKLVYIVL